jgi:hypothetical protein
MSSVIAARSYPGGQLQSARVSESSIEFGIPATT